MFCHRHGVLFSVVPLNIAGVYSEILFLLSDTSESIVKWNLSHKGLSVLD